MQEIKNMPERWCSTKEMCEYLGVSRDTLLTWINEKKMPASISLYGHSTKSEYSVKQKEEIISLQGFRFRDFEIRRRYK